MTKLMKKEKIVEIKTEVLPLVLKFEGKKISNPKEMEMAVSTLSELNKIKDRLTKEKEKLTKPLNETLKEVRSRYKPAEVQLDGFISILRDKISDYQTEKVLLEREEEERIAARIGDGKGHLKMETAERKFGEIERVDTQVTTDAGMVKFRTDYIVSIVNPELVPAVYVKEVIYDNEAIKMQHKLGVVVPGTKVEEKQTAINFR